MKETSTELRLGNLFIEKYSNEQIEVIELKKDEIMFSGDFKGKWQAEPIPLTEEWLIKFGFKNSGMGFYRKIESCMELINISDLYFRFYYKGKSVQADMNHVHQLQNLFHALTQKELTIK
jgi:hypothetical protein